MVIIWHNLGRLEAMRRCDKGESFRLRAPLFPGSILDD